MAIAAFISWLVTAVCGLGLISIWLIEYDGTGPATRLPKTAVIGHILLAVTGLVVWTLFLFTSARNLAWTTVVILVVVALLGLTMLLRWFGVFRTNRAPSPVLIPAGGLRTPTVQPPAPPERHLPIALIIVHGVVAVFTLLLVLLTALNVAGA